MANYKVSILYTRPNHRTDVPDAKEEEGFYYLFNSPDRSNAPIVKLLGNNATIHIYIVYNFYWLAVFVLHYAYTVENSDSMCIHLSISFRTLFFLH